MRQILTNLTDDMLVLKSNSQQDESVVLAKLSEFQEKASQRALYQERFRNELLNNMESRRLFRKGVLYKTEMLTVVQNSVIVGNRVKDLFVENDLEVLHTKIAEILKETS